jgi:hypothetical protein
MKVLITGSSGLAQALANAYSDQTVTLVSKSCGFDINEVAKWGQQFLDYHCVFNCAYDAFAQISVLEFFYGAWRTDCTKTIVTIGSKAVSGARAEKNLDNAYWPYRLHKQALQQAHDTMSRTANCNMKIINPGPIDTHMTQHLDVAKIDAQDLAWKIKSWVADPTIKRIDLWL